MRAVVFAGAGLGHYLPVSGLLTAMEFQPANVTVVAQTPTDGPLAQRARQDGYSFISLDGTQDLTPTMRRLDRLMKVALEWTSSKLAALLPADDMPPLSARLVLSARTYTRARRDISVWRRQALSAILDELRPGVVLVDTTVSPPFSVLCGPRRIPWIEYEICPVNVVSKSRPTYPAGMSPSMSPGERAANACLQLAARWQERRTRRLLAAESDQSTPPLRRFALSTSCLDDYRAAPQSAFEYVGIPGRLPNGPTKPWEDRDMIFVSLGSAPTGRGMAILQFLIPLLAALEPRWRSVLQLPGEEARRPLEALIIRQGSNTLLRGRSVSPPVDLYADARLVVSHGGYGTVLESLAAGAPVLLLPHVVADRMEVARRVLEAGVGRVANPRRLRPERLLRTIQAVLADEECARRVAKVQAELRRSTVQSTASLLPIEAGWV